MVPLGASRVLVSICAEQHTTEPLGSALRIEEAADRTRSGLPRELRASLRPR